MPLKTQITVHEVVLFLNEVLRLDRPAITSLFKHHVACSDGLAKHPTVQVRTEKEPHTEEEVSTVGLLGLLNGIFGCDSEEGGFIYITTDSESGIGLQFGVGPGEKSEPSRPKKAKPHAIKEESLYTALKVLKHYSNSVRRMPKETLITADGDVTATEISRAVSDIWTGDVKFAPPEPLCLARKPGLSREEWDLVLACIRGMKAAIAAETKAAPEDLTKLTLRVVEQIQRLEGKEKGEGL